MGCLSIERLSNAIEPCKVKLDPISLGRPIRDQSGERGRAYRFDFGQFRESQLRGGA